MKFFRIPLCVCLLFLSFHTVAQTKKENPIDVEYRACLAKDSSSANICNCAFIAYGKWNTEMDKAYKKLMSALKKEDEKATLKQSQAAWVAYKDAEFKSYDYMFNLPGSKWCGLRQDGRIDVVKARTLQLQDYLNALKERKR